MTSLMWPLSRADSSRQLSSMFTPSRLRLARARLGLTRTKLAELSGISLRTLTEYENEERSPSDDNLGRLSEVLSVPRSFFERDVIETIPVEAASFRKLSKASATRRDAVLANAALMLEFFEVLEQHFKLPTPAIPTLDKLGPARAAALVRHQWALGDRPISNMLHLLESKGVRVATLNHEYVDIDAFCFYRDAVPYVLLNTSKSAERQRFDLAHELGHLVLHSDTEMEAASSKEREAQANEFAANFLMPTSGVRQQLMSGASLERILSARSFWKVSAMAMTHRLKELDLVSDWQYRSICITLSERGFRREEPGGITPETSQLLRKVFYGGVARISFKVAAAELDLSPSEIRSYARDLVPMGA